MQRLLRSGQNQTRLTNGKIAVLNPDALDDFEQVLRDADPRQSQPGVYRLNKIQAGYLTNTAEEIGARLVGASKVLRTAKTTQSCLLGPLEAGSCATINSPACGGSPRSPHKILAESWPTRWASAKPCRHSLSFACIADTVRP